MVRAGLLFAVSIVLATACGDSPRENPPPRQPSHLEQTIASQLSAKLGRPARVSCMATSCRADLGDAVLPIAVTPGRGGTSWAISGLLVRSEPIEKYFSGALADLGAPQRVTCGPPIRSVEPGDRITCFLERGGMAFAVIAADGTFIPEIELDPAAAAARSIEPTEPLIDRSSSGSSSDDDDD